MGDDRSDLVRDIKRRYPGAKILATFPVLHVGWEMDNAGAVADLQNGSRVVFVTSHGGLYIEEGTQYLKKKVREYQAAAKATQEAIDLCDKSGMTANPT